MNFAHEVKSGTGGRTDMYNNDVGKRFMKVVLVSTS